MHTYLHNILVGAYLPLEFTTTKSMILLDVSMMLCKVKFKEQQD